MPGSKITYYDKDGNRKIFIGNPKNFKLPKGSLKEPSEPKPGRERQKRLDELDPPKPIKGGGFPKIGKPTPFKNKLALKGGGRAYGRNS